MEVEWRFDEEKAERVCNFIERYIILPETKTRFILSPFQRELVRNAYGRVNAAGNRVVRTIYHAVPKKNGKSALSSALMLYHLCADGEQAASVASVAGTAKQAGIVFGTAKAMVKLNPSLTKIIKPYKLSLVHERSGSSYEVFAADADNIDGQKFSAIAFDELHRQKDRALWDATKGAGLARAQPMRVVTTTAGDSRNSIAWEVHDYACRVRDGKRIDATWYPAIWEAGQEDDPHKVETWQAANPNLGVTFTLDDYRGLYDEAINAGPAAFNTWKRLHLNLWSNAVSAWLPLEQWDQCGTKNIDPEALKGRNAFCGVDISSTTDLTAIALLFPNDDGSYDILIFHYMPRANVVEAELRDGQPYRSWAEQGYLALTEGSTIDHAFIRRQIIDLNKRYPFITRQVAIDEFNAWQLMTELTSEGLEPIAVKQDVKGISPAAKAFYKAVLDGQLNHGRNPLLDWQASVVEIVEKYDDQIKPHKGKGGDRKRIDGIMAIIDAMSRAIVAKPPGKRRSVYEARGLTTLNELD